MSETFWGILFWPDRETVRQESSLGPEYCQLRTIIDCTEIWIQRPSNLQTQAECLQVVWT